MTRKARMSYSKVEKLYMYRLLGYFYRPFLDDELVTKEPKVEEESVPMVRPAVMTTPYRGLT